MESKMRSSRLGIFVLLLTAILFTTNCTYYNRIVSRKNLVDGSIAYKERNFQEAQELFRRAIARDPEGETLEGRMAQVFLARTLHSEFIGNRQRTDIAESAIVEYQKALQIDPNDQSSYKAVAGLLENLQKTDEWQRWVTERSTNESINPEYRAEALVSLAAKQNTCANEITDTEQTKKTVQRDGKDVFEYVKPEDPATFERLQKCVAEGRKLIDQAVALEPEGVTNAGSFDVKAATDEELTKRQNLLKIFESVRSYKASITLQDSRLAEMNGNAAEAERLRNAAEQAREGFLALSKVNEAIEAEKTLRAAAANANANADANAEAPAANTEANAAE